MHQHLTTIFKSEQLFDRKGQRHILNSNISIEEGLYIQEIINDIKPKISLEIGLAQGVSAMFICEALIKVNANMHIVIDPGQVKMADSGDNWSGLGLYNLEKCGYLDIVDFKDEPSEIILPKLLEQELKIDFAFIDGWHTFDHVLIDFFYINRILNVGGVIVFDDSNMNSINKVINYIRNYPCYESYTSNTQFAKKYHRSKFTWSNVYEKIIKKPYRLPIIILRLLSRNILLLKNQFAKNTLDMKKNIRISRRYYAIQKISNDTRSWNWYQNF